MKARSSLPMSRLLLSASVLALSTSCSSGLSPVGSKEIVRQPQAAASPPEAFGAQAIVTTDTHEYRGEIIACHQQTLFMLANKPRPDAYVCIHLPATRSMELNNTRRGSFATWGGIGLVSTASHGLLVPFSAPVWIIVGSLVVGLAAGPTKLQPECSTFTQHARFPRGMPPQMVEHFRPNGTCANRLPQAGVLPPMPTGPMQPPGSTTPILSGQAL